MCGHWNIWIQGIKIFQHNSYNIQLLMLLLLTIVKTMQPPPCKDCLSCFRKENLLFSLGALCLKWNTTTNSFKRYACWTSWDLVYLEGSPTQPQLLSFVKAAALPHDLKVLDFLLTTNIIFQSAFSNIPIFGCLMYLQISVSIIRYIFLIFSSTLLSVCLKIGSKLLVSFLLLASLFLVCIYCSVCMLSHMFNKQNWN